MTSILVNFLIFVTLVRKVVATGSLTKSVRKVIKSVRKAVGALFLRII